MHGAPADDLLVRLGKRWAAALPERSRRRSQCRIGPTDRLLPKGHRSHSLWQRFCYQLAQECPRGTVVHAHQHADDVVANRVRVHSEQFPKTTSCFGARGLPYETVGRERHHVTRMAAEAVASRPRWPAHSGWVAIPQEQRQIFASSALGEPSQSSRRAKVVGPPSFSVSTAAISASTR